MPIMALTATANEQVIGDIVDRLRIQKCVRLTQSFNRPNLFYEIRPKKRNVLSDIGDFIKNGHVKDTGVIYCLSRKKCEFVISVEPKGRLTGEVQDQIRNEPSITKN